MMTNEETVDVLNELLTKAYDAEQGYETAAKKADDSARLRRFFESQSKLRRVIGKDLKDSISLHGGEPDKGASLTAKAHQIWITLKDLTTGKDESAVLEECERGEEAALEGYDEILQKEGLSVEVQDMLRRQRAMIETALEMVREKEAVAS